MDARIATEMGYLAIGLIGLGLGTIVITLCGNRDSAPVRYFRLYVESLDSQLKRLQSRVSAQRMALAQLLAAATLLALTIALQSILCAALAAALLLIPRVKLQRLQSERIDAIDAQIDTWLVALSSALRASPSLGDAISSTIALTPAPLRDELALTMKENSLGSPLDRALRQMGTRVGSRALTGALGAILVARKTGGNVSRVLDQSADSLREMARLDGVVRSKTAEGRSQALLLGAIPFVLVGAIHMMDDTWLAPLTGSALGILIVAISSALWLGGFVLARRILSVDI